MRRELHAYVGGPDPGEKVLQASGELQRMYEYVLGIEGDGAFIAGRSTLVSELAAMRHWRATIAEERSAKASGPQVKPDPDGPARGQDGRGAMGPEVAGMKPFPQGPAADIFELYSALAQHGLLPVLSSKGGSDSARFARPVRRPFDPAGAVKRLYEAMPLQCPLTGRRFPRGSERLLRSHMDAVFKRSQRKAGGPPPSRPWYRTLDEWLARYGADQLHSSAGAELLAASEGKQAQANGNGDADMSDAEVGHGAPRRPARPAVPVPEGLDPAGLTCALSGEPLDVFYDDEAEQWMALDAVVLSDGTVAHTSACDADALV